MTREMIIEGIGYLGSALVLVSFLMTSVVRLRIVNTVGSVIFCVYAFIIRSYPTAVMNLVLVLINLHFLWKVSRGAKDYDLLAIRPDGELLKHLTERFGEDILRFFPGTDLTFPGADTAYVVLCEEAPAGFLVGRREEKSLHLLLDYSLPKYRDYSIGRFLKNAMPGEGFDCLRFEGADEHHLAYLKKTGFVRTDSGWECRL